MRWRYDSSNIWKTLAKRQRRQLEMSARILWFYHQYFVANLDVCYTEYPAQMLLDEKYEEKIWGEDLYGGWKGLSDRGASFTKTGLVGAIEL